MNVLNHHPALPILDFNYMSNSEVFSFFYPEFSGSQHPWVTLDSTSCLMCLGEKHYLLVSFSDSMALNRQWL